MLTLGGAGLLDFIGPLAAIGRVDRLAPLVEIARIAGQPGGLRMLPWQKRRRLMREIWTRTSTAGPVRSCSTAWGATAAIP